MAESVEATLKADVRDIFETGAINPSIGTRPVAQAARGLLRIFRDHVPDNYFRACRSQSAEARLITSASRARST